MSNQQKVDIVTGAAPGIGAGQVKAFREGKYRVIANFRSVKPSGHPRVISIPGDIAASEGIS